MTNDEPSPPPSPYCVRLGVKGLSLPTFAADRTVTLRQLALAVILLRSGPVSFDELVEALEALASRGSGPRLRASVVKSLAGSTAIVRLPDGRFDVDLSDHEWHWFRFKASAPRSDAPPAPAPTTAPSPGPDEPISRAEIEGLLTEVEAQRLTSTARLVAVLDVVRRPVSADEVEACLVEWTGAKGLGSASSLKYLSSPLVRRRADGRFERVDPASLSPAANVALRRARIAIRAAIDAGRAEQAWRARWAKEKVGLEQDHRRRVVEAECARRALVHAVRIDDRVVAVTLLDAIERTATTLVGDAELARLAQRLRGYDVLVGLDICGVLAALGQLNAPPARVVDLASVPRTLRVRGRVVKVSAADWIRGSIGVPNGLDPARRARDVASGDRARVVSGLEREAKLLFAFYRYGVVHRSVRLRADGFEHVVLVDWAEPGDASLVAYLEEIKAGGGPVEIALPPLPPFETPWSRTVLLSADADRLVIEPTGPHPLGRRSVSLGDVLDVRRR